MAYVKVPCLCAIAVALSLGAWSSSALGAIFGTLSNFDVVNDTLVGGVGQECHGFEIELDGVTPADIVYTFGAPYNRYGEPVKIDIGTGTIVRYSASFNGTAWSTFTPYATTAITTGGHQFWTGGDPAYPAGVPGDHFGIALNGNPTNTIYRWLIGDASGNLSPVGTNVKIPAPVWVVQPPANPVAPAAVQVVVPALPKENPGDLWGEAMWVKVFVTESSAPAVLDQLLVGEAGVPGRDHNGDLIETEVEVEWQLLQAGKGNGLDEVDSGLNDMGAGNESVTRRYEFYKYIGPYDLEGEATEESPGANLEFVGDFIGGQNAAMNLAAFDIAADVPEPATLALLGIGAAAFLSRRRQ